MNEESAKNEIAKLSAELKHYDYLYRIKNAPEISDSEYDLKVKQLAELESKYPEFALEDSPTKKVSSDLDKSFKQVEHLSPMLSLDNTFSLDELRKFDTRLKKILNTTGDLEYQIEPKIDGAGISLVYENGKLVRALTRGNGKIGEDITRNIKIIKGIAQKLSGENLPSLVELRGEVYMTREEFVRISKVKEEEHISKQQELFESGNTKKTSAKKKTYANPRNLAAGTMKLLDEKELLKRNLESIFYFVGESKKFSLRKQSDLKDSLKKWGISAMPWNAVAVGVDAVYEKILELDKLRSEFPFDTDGAVIKLNDTSLWELAGMTEKAPRWAIAWKYDAVRTITKLNAITLQIGRTGAITPVAELEPVFLSGSTVSRATLHNADEILRKDIRVGDDVLIEKAGEIIPAIIQVENKNLRSENSVPFEFPKNCPVCNTLLVRDESEAVYRCPNSNCPEQVKRRIEHFASRNCMDIEGFGEALVEKLFEKDLIKSQADIYKITKEDLLSLENFGEKSADNILSAISKSKEQDLWRVIFGLGIFNVGEKIAKDLADVFGTLESLASASYETLIAIGNIGEEIANSVLKFFSNQENMILIDTLKKSGVNFKNKTVKSSELSNTTFVITGTLDSLSREGAKSLIEKHGGRVSSSVSKETTYLLAGKEAGSKLKKAQELNIKILTESEFLSMIKPDSKQDQMELF